MCSRAQELQHAKVASINWPVQLQIYTLGVHIEILRVVVKMLTIFV